MPGRTRSPDPGSRLHLWRQTLRDQHRHSVRVTLTRNRSTLVSIHPRSRRESDLRVHEAFEHAPGAILDDLASVILRKNPEAWRRIRQYAQSLQVAEPSSPSPAPPPPRMNGTHFQLDGILEEVKNRFFTPDLKASITWGNHGRSRRRKRRSIRFASWHEDRKLIRVHPLLDQDWVPMEFMRYLIYHELCHAVEKPLGGTTGKRRIHHRPFKQLEAQYPDFPEMEALSRRVFERIVREEHLRKR